MFTSQREVVNHLCDLIPEESDVLCDFFRRFGIVRVLRYALECAYLQQINDDGLRWAITYFIRDEGTMVIS